MKPINPIEALQQVNGANPQVSEQAELHVRAHGRMQSGVPDSATGQAARDATLSWGGGYSMSVNPGGPLDTAPHRPDVTKVDGVHSSVAPEADRLDGGLTTVPHDGFGRAGSWSELSKRV